MLHRDISFGNVLFGDEPSFEGFVTDLDYSEAILMPNEVIDGKRAGQISKSLKSMTVSHLSDPASDPVLNVFTGDTPVHGD